MTRIDLHSGLLAYPLDLEPVQRTVVLAEEDDETRLRLTEELERVGYHVVGVEDGLALRAYLAAAYATDCTVTEPSLVISDASLPGGGGLEVCDQLHHQSHWPPFIVLAEHDQSEVFEAAERAGADFVFDKPIDVDELRSVVRWLAAATD